MTETYKKFEGSVKMILKNMFGVVLWSDTEDHKAVIWCEDHGDLAYYVGADQSALEGVALDAGDLIQFDMRQDSKLRLARNPQLVVEQEYPGLASRLSAPVPQRTVRRQAERLSRKASNVISIDAFRGNAALA
jgi:hypothetical protein